MARLRWHDDRAEHQRSYLGAAGWVAFVTAVPLVLLLALFWNFRATALQLDSLAIGGNTTCSGCVCISTCAPSLERSRCTVDEVKCPGFRRGAQAESATAWDYCAFSGCPGNPTPPPTPPPTPLPTTSVPLPASANADTVGAAPLESAVTEVGQGFKLHTSSDIAGHDLSQQPGNGLSLLKCAQMCFGMPSCLAFTWPGCQLKDVSTETSMTHSTAYATYVRINGADTGKANECDGGILPGGHPIRVFLCHHGISHGSAILQASVCESQAELPCASDGSLAHDVLDKGAHITLISVPMGHALLGMAVDDFLTRHPEFFIRSISNTSEGVVLAKHMKPLTLVSVPSASASLRPCIIAKYAGTCRRSPTESFSAGRAGIPELGTGAAGSNRLPKPKSIHREN
jgi:hypothetical protein